MKQAPFIRIETGRGELLSELDLSHVGRDIARLEVEHPTLNEIKPVFFSMLGQTNDIIDAQRVVSNLMRDKSGYLDFVRPTPHRTVKESKRELAQLGFMRASEYALLLACPDLEGFYWTVGYKIAEEQAGGFDALDNLSVTGDRFGMFASLADMTRADIHVDGRNPTMVVNASQGHAIGATLIAPASFKKKKRLTVEDMAGNQESIRLRMSPNVGVCFDVSRNPHVGVREPGRGTRAILEFNYAKRGVEIDNSVVDEVYVPHHGEAYLEGAHRAMSDYNAKKNLQKDLSTPLGRGIK